VDDFIKFLPAIFEEHGWQGVALMLQLASHLEADTGSQTDNFQRAVGTWLGGQFLKDKTNPDLNEIFSALAAGRPWPGEGKYSQKPGFAFVDAVMASRRGTEVAFNYYLNHPAPVPDIASIQQFGGAYAERFGWITTIDKLRLAVSPQIRDSFAQSVICSWSYNDVEAASTWIKNLPVGDLRQSSVQALVEQLCSEGDFAAARAWVPFGPANQIEQMKSAVNAREKSRSKMAK
jgi:hypothetical protein